MSKLTTPIATVPTQGLQNQGQGVDRPNGDASHLKPGVTDAVTAAGAGITQQDISRRAFELFVEGGRKPGQSQINWRDAEKELQSQAQVPSLAERLADSPDGTHR